MTVLGDLIAGETWPLFAPGRLFCALGSLHIGHNGNVRIFGTKTALAREVELWSRLRGAAGVGNG